MDPLLKSIIKKRHQEQVAKELNDYIARLMRLEHENRKKLADAGASAHGDVQQPHRKTGASGSEQSEQVPLCLQEAQSPNRPEETAIVEASETVSRSIRPEHFDCTLD